YLLSCTHGKERFFVTPEYEVLRYSAILAAKQVSNNAFKKLTKQLPTLEQMEDSMQIENEPIPDYQKITKELEPLVKFIDFNQIKGKILTDIIEPLEIIPNKIIVDAYRRIARSHNAHLNGSRGIQKLNDDSNFVWDESACGSELIIEDNGRVVR